MHFANPEYFWLLLLLPVLAGFFLWAHQQRQKALGRFAQMALIRKLTPSSTNRRRALKALLFLLFFLFFALALTRPRFGVKMEMIQRKGVDIMIALDISRSMMAEDVVPNRLDRAKYEIAKFIDLLKGDRVGLIVFAGESFVQCPLTLDYGAAKMFLDAVNCDWVGVQGTDISDAITQGVKAFKTEKKKRKIMLLLSDGEDNEGDPSQAAQQAADNGVRIYTVGIGSESGVPIPVQKGGGNIVYKKDNTGNLVMTRLNPAVLEKIALETKGSYYHAGTDLDLTRIYNEIAKMEKTDLGANKTAVYEERYQIFLLCALVLIVVEFFVAERVRRSDIWKGRFD